MRSNCSSQLGAYDPTMRALALIKIKYHDQKRQIQNLYDKLFVRPKTTLIDWLLFVKFVQNSNIQVCAFESMRRSTACLKNHYELVSQKVSQ